ncbi:MAG: hypothetical protein ACI9TK_000983 [Flavobacteriaceae bacterium]|jgi:hypothetical protein|tara:strand:+ start:11889 stop:12536 length:648 start_codon:yes stop_codon:yes gene_type:complete
MKINYLIILLILLGTRSFSQDIEGNKISQVYEVRGVSAAQVFSNINFATALVYQNANDVVVFNDPDSKRLIIKARALVPVINSYKVMNPKDPSLLDYVDYSHDYTIVLEAREGKYRIEMQYQDGKYYDSEGTDFKLPFPAKMDYIAADFELFKQKAIEEMNQDYFESTSKKKKELYIQSQPRLIENYQKTLKEYATILFQSLYKKILDDLREEAW